MQVPPLPRKLWYQGSRERITVDQGFLISDPRSLIVLGEAGMGKSTLLQQLKNESGFTVCTARKLINSPDPLEVKGDATTLVIDALDEVSTRLDGDAVDLVLRRLAEMALPRFILSSRIADWRKATALQGINDFYEVAPLELHLEPLNREDAAKYLREKISPEAADSAISHLEEKGLGGLWRNPQTLKLIAEVVAAGTLPTSKGALFKAATKLMRSEHREEKSNTPLARLAQDDLLDAAGAAFATLILTGKEAISRKVQALDSDIALAEVSCLPGATALPDILGSRLFSAVSDDRFTYDHRAIGEFLGARWLARYADTTRKQRRILDLFNGEALVPASLRGLHAWLAWHSPTLSEQVIEADPMGLIEYGDGDELTVPQGRALFAALRRVSEANPQFRDWSEYRTGGLIQLDLLHEIREAISGQRVEFGLRLLVLQALKRSPLIDKLHKELAGLLLSAENAFAIRSEAGDRLVEGRIKLDWSATFDRLLDERSETSVRLVAELMNQIGYDNFSDALVLDCIRAQFDQSRRSVGAFMSLERNIPDQRLDLLICGIAKMAEEMGRPYERHEDGAISDLFYGLLARRLKLPLPSVEELWSWLEPFDEQSGFARGSREEVSSVFQGNNLLRRELQRYVLLDRPGAHTPWQRCIGLVERSNGLRPDEMDICELLAMLANDDSRWRDLVSIVSHSPEHGAAVREQAYRFAAGDPEAMQWLAGLAIYVVPEWKIQQETRARARQAERDAAWVKHRKEFKAHIDELRRGDYGYVINPAQGYLKLFRDMGDNADNGPERLLEWLGPELCDAALAGFDAFLKLDPPLPSATDILESHAEGKRWSASFIIVAALAERQRTGKGFEDLPDERLMAGLFELRHTRIDNHAGITGLDDLLVDELRKRGSYETALRQFFETQLAAGRQHVDGLYALMRNEENSALADLFAVDWIVRFPQMSTEAESEILDRLLATKSGRATLRKIVQDRRTADLSHERRLTWNAVGIIVDFTETVQALSGFGGIDSALLWHLRARLGDRRHGVPRTQLDVEQLAWTITTFRPFFPAEQRPEGVTTGDANPWDATDYLTALIMRLGDDTSSAAADALVKLRDAPSDGYTDVLRVAVAEQKRKRVEAEWRSLELNTVISAIKDSPPTTASQFLAILLEELATVQAKIKGSDINWYRDFFDGGEPAVEERCRDTIIKMFGMLPFGIKAMPEGVLADSKRCDIICLLGDMMIPIEIKGQWHRDLWTAADNQLDLLYTNDHRAERGIYLVLWFGDGTIKPLKAPPKGVTLPSSIDGLRDALVGLSASTGDGRTEILVLDITRPS